MYDRHGVRHVSIIKSGGGGGGGGGGVLCVLHGGPDVFVPAEPCREVTV